LVTEICRKSGGSRFVLPTWLLRQAARHAGARGYEDYYTEDFALGSQIVSDIALPHIQPGATATPPTTLLLGYMYRPFTANTGMVRLTYLW
jgi:hypothetical protein